MPAPMMTMSAARGSVCGCALMMVLLTIRVSDVRPALLLVQNSRYCTHRAQDAQGPRSAVARLVSSLRDAIALHYVRNWLESSGARATSVGLSALAVAGPVREQPRPSHPTAHSPRGGDPGGARRKALVTADASAPGGAGSPTRQPRWGAEAAPFAATRERL